MYISHNTFIGFLWWELQNSGERNKVRPKLIETHRVVMGWMTQYGTDINSPKLIYGFQTLLIKTLEVFVDMGMLILKFMFKDKWTIITKAMFKKQSKVWSITLLILIYSNQHNVILVKGRNIDQWNNIKFRINKNKYRQLIFDKGEKAIQWRRDNLFNKRYWGT